MRSRWLVGVGVALAVAVGFLAVSCKGKSNPAGPGMPADFTVQINGSLGTNSYSPDTVTVKVGQTVAWHNTDGITHTATGNGVPMFDTGPLNSGNTSAPIQMNSTGTFGYHCTIHGLSMSGAVKVTP